MARSQGSGIRNQGSVVSNQRSGIRGQESGVRNHGLAIRGQESGARNQGSGITGQESQVRNQGSGTRGQEPVVRNRGSGIKGQGFGSRDMIDHRVESTGCTLTKCRVQSEAIGVLTSYVPRHAVGGWRRGHQRANFSTQLLTTDPKHCVVLVLTAFSFK